ncbi:MAG: Type 1 glutamine amidotransferase-like domain-containing protein [Candidatus Pacebacteria bacterium]|nr:Type 1 glutamine amidotransferase-like domain-containing protein [Candidatus Paceibacterota bacterium]
MIKYVLVGGKVHAAPDNGRAFVSELVKDFTDKPVKILICLFAVPKEQRQEKIIGDREYFSKFISDFEIELADENIFTDQVRHSDVIFLRGGHTRPLMDLLTKNLNWLKELDGKVLAGTSAGAEVISRYYFVTKTNRNGDGLGLLPIKFIPHWKSSYFDDEPQNIDWDKIYSDFKNYKEDLELITLKEGEFRVIKQ